MGKKLKQMAEGSGKGELAKAIRDSAQQIWLAGLGAFAKAQEEGGKVFEALVKEGQTIQKRTKEMTDEKVAEVTDKVSKSAGGWSKQASESWDKLESIFEDRVSRALGRLGVPTSKDMQDLLDRVEALTASVEKLAAQAPAAAKPAVKPATKKVVEAVAEVAAVVDPVVEAKPKAPAKPRVRKPAAPKADAAPTGAPTEQN